MLFLSNDSGKLYIFHPCLILKLSILDEMSTLYEGIGWRLRTGDVYDVSAKSGYRLGSPYNSKLSPVISMVKLAVAKSADIWRSVS